MKTTRRTMTVSELKAAPGDLRIAQTFVNTVDRVHGTELLTSPRALAGWLNRVGMPAAERWLTPADVGRTIEAREGVRALLAANNGVRMDAAAADRLDRALESALLRVRVEPGGATRLEAAGEGLNYVFARLLALVHDARAAGTWARLKACAEPACRAAFYDASPNRSGVWCAMRRCGNRVKSDAWRRRDKHRGRGW